MEPAVDDEGVGLAVAAGGALEGEEASTGFVFGSATAAEEVASKWVVLLVPPPLDVAASWGSLAFVLRCGSGANFTTG